jgi:hypothetical protein
MVIGDGNRDGNWRAVGKPDSSRQTPIGQTYVFIKSEPQLWTVGFYKPDGTWESESDWESSGGAAERVSYLNGGKHLQDIIERLERLEEHEHEDLELKALLRQARPFP